MKYITTLSLLILLMLVSCYQSKTGCLDINATNFDVSTDLKCDSCCTYPKLILNMTYKYDTNLLALNKTYTDNYTNNFQIISAKCFISDLQLIDNNGNILKTKDSLRIYRPNGDSLWVSNSFALIGKEGFQFPFGSLLPTSNIRQIRFRVGLSDTVRTAIQSKIPQGHPLAENRDSMYVNGQYLSNKLVIARGTRFLDTIKLNISTPTWVTLYTNTNLPLGYDINVPLGLNYKNWLLGVDISSNPTTTIQAKIYNNTSLGFGF